MAMRVNRRDRRDLFASERVTQDLASLARSTTNGGGPAAFFPLPLLHRKIHPIWNRLPAVELTYVVSAVRADSGGDSWSRSRRVRLACLACVGRGGMLIFGSGMSAASSADRASREAVAQARAAA